MMKFGKTLTCAVACAGIGVVSAADDSNFAVTNGDVVIHTFRTSGTLHIPNDTTAEILVGGGGGGGGVIHETGVVLATGDYPVTVGAGGAGSTKRSVNGGNGGNSVFKVSDELAYTAIGGGGGGSPSESTGNAAPGCAGGSGGGGSVRFGVQADIYADGGDGTEGQGNAGGYGFISKDTRQTHFWQTAGGGGGASAAGGNGSYESGAPVSGSGGAGRICSITGEEVCYAGGGGGGTEAKTQGAGGAGGGGAGGNVAGLSKIAAYPEPGTNGLGGGGGGGGCYRSGGSYY